MTRSALKSSSAALGKPMSAKTLPLLMLTSTPPRDFFREVESLRDEIELVLRRRDAAVGFLFERVEDIHHISKSGRVHEPVGYVVARRNDLGNLTEAAFHRLGIAVRSAFLRNP